MSDASTFDKVTFPGGYDIAEIIVAVALAAVVHVKNPNLGMTDHELLRRFLVDLATRHPESAPFRNLDDPYHLRAQELFDERLSLVNSHLRASWFSFSYWFYGLMAARSGLSIAEFDDVGIFLTPVRLSLRELGVQASNEELLAEIDRFIPSDVTPRNVLAAVHLFLSFARFLHNGALRRRTVVTLQFTLPSICLAFEESDAEEARRVSTFLNTHGISIIQQPGELTRSARLLVFLSRQAMASEIFWRSLADWKERQVVPMVVCLMPKAELYCEPPAEWWREIWTWLRANIAVELSSENDRYLMLLRALDPSDPKQWWWSYADEIELGLATDVLRLGIPRPAVVREGSGSTGEPYPYHVDGSLFSACFVASDRLTRNEASRPDERYSKICQDLLQLRRKANGEPYGLPWFLLIYRVWLAFAAQLAGFAYPEQEAVQARREMRLALFALGIGTENAAEFEGFLESFANLPWAAPASTLAVIDERTIAFVILVYHLSQAALTRSQRMRLLHPFCPAFVSYAREDESFARELVARLEAKGADVWWDLTSITLGQPLDESLRSAVVGARYLVLIATAAAGKSSYVHLEIETAIRHGLRVVPIIPSGERPAALRSLLNSAAGTTEPIIFGTDSERASIPTLVLARLERSPAEQLRWLQAQPPYQTLCKQIAQARMSHA